MSIVAKRSPILATAELLFKKLTGRSSLLGRVVSIKFEARLKYTLLEMWANAQPDGRNAEYRWRPLFNAAKFG